MKKFHLKKIGHRGKIVIWLVDGAGIRSNLGKEFTNFGHHFDFAFIPKYEFWLDKEAVPNERRFFIDHLLTEWRLIKTGYSRSAAAKMADSKERSERIKAGGLKKIINNQGAPLIKKIHDRLLKKIKKSSVWLVRGDLVRNIFNIEFTEGGHDLVYNFVPKDEVWIDNDVLAKERSYVILHELYEHSLMEKGLIYPEAHRKASKIEWKARHNKKKLEENLALLGWEINN